MPFGRALRSVGKSSPVCVCVWRQVCTLEIAMYDTTTDKATFFQFHITVLTMRILQLVCE